MGYAVSYNIFMLGCCGYAAWCGAGDERLGAALMFIASMITSGVVLLGRGYGGEVFAIDVIVLVLLLALALKSDRYWPMWAAGFHLVGVLTHAAVRVDAAIEPLAKAHALGLWSYLTLAALALGTRNVVKSTGKSLPG